MKQRHSSSDSRPTLGVVAICFEEERDLPGFLDNLSGWVDEIVLVDDGSTDGSSTIAADHGGLVKFIVSPRKPAEFFSDQRNKGIDASESDWLLHMDVDERVSPELAAEMLSAITSRDLDAFRFRRLNFFLHRPVKSGGWETWNQVHLARREVLRFGGMFHESCNVDVSPERVGQLEGLMWHLNDADFGERMKKSDLYVIEAATKIRESGERVGWFDLVFRPAKRFVRQYVVAMGFRDGMVGLIAALHSATAEFRSCVLVWDEQNQIPRDRIEHELAELWRGQSLLSGSRGSHSTARHVSESEKVDTG